MSECGCVRCVEELVAREPYTGANFFDPRLMRFFACQICGNKRCPHATDHRYACTNSNEPGQKGSRYE